MRRIPGGPGITLNNLIEKLTAGGQFKILNKGTDVEREVTGTYCCDLLSIAMSRAPEGCAWVTVMGNINTLAVAALTDAACIILAEGVTLDEPAAQKAGVQDITVLRTEQPVFESALEIHRALQTEESAKD